MAAAERQSVERALRVSPTDRAKLAQLCQESQRTQSEVRRWLIRRAQPRDVPSVQLGSISGAGT